MSLIASLIGGEAADRGLSVTEIALSIAVLVFTLIVMGIVGALAWKRNQGWGASTSRLFIISLVVGAAMFLLTAGYTQDQMTPVIGLLGTKHRICSW